MKTPKKKKTVPTAKVFAEFRKQPGYQEAYDAVEDEFTEMSRNRTTDLRRKPVHTSGAQRN
jgi:hypothetical protein